eukprot:737609-Amphidinium_carterae.2
MAFGLSLLAMLSMHTSALSPSLIAASFKVAAQDPLGIYCASIHMPPHVEGDDDGYQHGSADEEDEPWIPGFKYGKKHCKYGQACRNPTCGFAHPANWPHSSDAQVHPDASSDQQAITGSAAAASAATGASDTEGAPETRGTYSRY